MSGSWESLKAKAKNLKSDLDAKMQELGRLNKRLSSLSTDSGSDRMAAMSGQAEIIVGIREDVERGLVQLEDTCEALGRVAATSAQSAQAARFRETQQELKRDFKRVAQTIEHQQQHSRLLPKVRSRHQSGSDDVEAGLIQERNAIGASLDMTDEILCQARETHTMLKNQRSVLGGVQGKVTSLDSILPGINSLIDKISDRKNKERVVLSITVAGCCFFTIWYKFL